MKPTYWIKWLVTVTVIVFSLAGCLAPESASPTPEPTLAPTAVPTAAPTAASPDTTSAGAPVIEGEPTLVTESGLKYYETVAGTGSSPQLGDLVTMHFAAYLEDGTLLADTYQMGEPAVAVFGRDDLLPGWQEGLGLMKVGGSAQLVLPPELAFGVDGGGGIPANATILMTVDLISIEAPAQPTEVSESSLTTTESGLQYFDLQEGTGELAENNATVSTHFTIWVREEQGDFYAVSSEGSQPLSFVLGRGDVVFPGWEEGVLGMKVGGKRLLVISPELGLGEQGAGNIPANATLVMEIELVDVLLPAVRTEVAEEDYIVTPTGLKYVDLVVGTGAAPTAGQTVVVHYTGWLEDGTQFDSSLDRGTPFNFVLGGGNVIAGWDEGVASMLVGGKRQLVIPANLAYGDQGAGGVIPPGATLIFEVELLEVRP